MLYALLRAIINTKNGILILGVFRLHFFTFLLIQSFVLFFCQFFIYILEFLGFFSSRFALYENGFSIIKILTAIPFGTGKNFHQTLDVTTVWRNLEKDEIHSLLQPIHVAFQSIHFSERLIKSERKSSLIQRYIISRQTNSFQP